MQLVVALITLRHVTLSTILHAEITELRALYPLIAATASKRLFQKVFGKKKKVLLK
jgi:hypothetical protein